MSGRGQTVQGQQTEVGNEVGEGVEWSRTGGGGGVSVLREEAKRACY